MIIENNGLSVYAPRAGYYPPESSFFLSASSDYFQPYIHAGHGVAMRDATVKYEFIEEDPRQILQGYIGSDGNVKRSVTRDVKSDPALMVLNFAPKNSRGDSIDLSCLAKELGVDHFNWLQTVTGPGNWRFDVHRTVQLPNGNVNRFITGPASAPYYDPFVQVAGDDTFDTYSIRVDGNALNDVRRFEIEEDANGGPYFDKHAAYYAELPHSEEWKSYIDPSKTIFQFRDRPQVPDYALSGENYFLSFTTELVGIESDGDIKHFNVPGLKYRWKSNAVHDGENYIAGGVSRAGYFGDLAVEAPIISGGVFDFEEVVIPEPPLSLMAVTALTIIYLGYFKLMLSNS
ncbi:MAG: hypothetical protein SFX18_13710 [Pirellulales bacterium]|nr:hypothetical protein [Pirellulales bacterium]